MTQQGQAKNDRFDQAYDDMQGEVETTLVGASQWLVAAIGDTGFYIPWLQAGQNDYFQKRSQMTHRKKLGAVMKSSHVHYVLSTAPTAGQTVILNYAYTWVNAEDAIPAIGSWTTGTKTITFAGTEAANKYT